MIAYLDTHVLVWVLEGDFKQLTRRALEMINVADLLVSPMVLLELEYLYEIKRNYVHSRDVQRLMQQELNVQVCTVPFAAVAEAALDEKWTRDPFDRMIVAQAKANGFSTLVTADEKIRNHYPAVIW